VSLRTLVFLRRGGQVLLLRRSAAASPFPGLFNGLGGHVEPGEDVLASALREVREETGLQPRGLTLRGVLHATEAGRNEGVLVLVFAGDAPDETPLPPSEGEFAWLDPADPERLPLVPDLPHMLPMLWPLDGAIFMERTSLRGGRPGRAVPPS
jgi:8-oxo-dGTP diphosphatase